jgi:hypothetical protein
VSKMYWMGDAPCRCTHALDDHTVADDGTGNPHGGVTIPCRLCRCLDWEDGVVLPEPPDELVARRTGEAAST